MGYRVKAGGEVDPFGVYLKEISRNPLLTAAEEIELAARVKAGDRGARDRLVTSNLRLVIKVARAYVRRGLDLEDLIEEGNTGLIIAAGMYDPSGYEYPPRFSTYAVHWIKQCVRRALADCARTIRLPSHMFQLIGRFRDEAARLAFELGRDPEFDEVADRMGIPKKKRKLVKSAIATGAFTHWHDNGEDPADPMDSAPDHRAPDAAGAAEDADVFKFMNDYINNNLNEKRAIVLRLRFGLDGEGARTLDAVGEHIGVARERVRQIERAALAEISEAMAG